MTDAEVDWERIRVEFGERRTAALGAAVVDASLDVAFLARTFAGQLGAGDACSRFTRLWRQALEAGPEATRLAAFFVYGRAQREWELTADHERIAATLRAAWAAWQEVDPDPAPERLDVSVTLRHALSIVPAMRAEDALNCSCPDRLEIHAQRVMEESAELRALLTTDVVATPYGHLLDRVLEAHERYYRGVRASARAVGRALASPGGATDTLVAAAGEIRSLEDDLRGDVYASELRPHRQVLEVLAQHPPPDPSRALRLGEVRLVYLYPFRLGLGRLPSTGLTSARVGGCVVSDLHLSDVWRVDRVAEEESPGAGDHEGSRLTGVYAGKVLTVGALHLGPSAAGLAGDYDVEIHLNDPGNHYVRISSGVCTDPTLHELYQGIRRGSVHMGMEAMRAPLVSGEPGIGGDRGTMAEYAERLVTSLAAALGSPDVDPDGPMLDGPGLALDVERDGHVLVEIRAARTGDRAATPDELLASTGRLLWQPIQNYATALDEWLLLPTPAERPTNILGFAAQRDELGLSSNHVTVLYSPHAPSWKLHGYEELVEFCVTLPCLRRSWIAELDEQTKRLRLQATVTGSPTIAELEALEGTLHDERLRLARRALDIRIVRERMERVAAAANRALMRNMKASVHVEVYDSALEARLELQQLAADTVAQRTRSIRERLEAEDRRSDERYQRRVSRLLHAITILGLAGFLSYLNSLFTETPLERIWAASELAVLVVLGAALWWFIQHRDPHPQDGHADQVRERPPSGSSRAA